MRRSLPAKPGAFDARFPCPCVAKPESRQKVEWSRVRAAVGYRDANQDVVLGGLGVFHEDVEVAVLIEHARVQEFELGVAATAPGVLLDQSGVWEGRLGIFIKPFHVGVCWR